VQLVTNTTRRWQQTLAGLSFCIC